MLWEAQIHKRILVQIQNVRENKQLTFKTI